MSKDRRLPLVAIPKLSKVQEKKDLEQAVCALIFEIGMTKMDLPSAASGMNLVRIALSMGTYTPILGIRQTRLVVPVVEVPKVKNARMTRIGMIVVGRVLTVSGMVKPILAADGLATNTRTLDKQQMKHVAPARLSTSCRGIEKSLCSSLVSIPTH
mmetsp:Transcript_9896/g.14554  ORF Transcript_9896/g.14554 Transcript_9896/m.14554 type:complete len:156 (+) Transcript_9896:861-1328(+)